MCYYYLKKGNVSGKTVRQRIQAFAIPSFCIPCSPVRARLSARIPAVMFSRCWDACAFSVCAMSYCPLAVGDLIRSTERPPTVD